MSLIKHLRNKNPNFDQEFKVTYFNAIKKLPFNIFKSAVLGNMKQTEEVKKAA